MKILFFGYREWSINIFKELSKESKENIILCTNKNSCNLEFINSFKPDLILFYGWSWKIENLIIDKYFCICLHPSKLPKYRGGSPLQNQLINNEKDSAVTLFKMNGEIDKGHIISQKYLSLDGYLDDIFQKIEKLGFEMTLELFENFKKNDIKLYEQSESDSTFFKRRHPSQSEIKIDDFKNYEASYFYNLVRGLQNPYPMAFIECKNGTKLFISKVSYE